jgi:hypothetical protein
MAPDGPHRHDARPALTDHRTRRPVRTPWIFDDPQGLPVKMTAQLSVVGTFDLTLSSAFHIV